MLVEYEGALFGGRGTTINLARRGSRATLGIPGTGMSWQFAGHSHIHKAIQAQSDIKAVHPQATVKAVQAQAEIIGITKRMERVAKRLTRNAAGGTCREKSGDRKSGVVGQDAGMSQKRAKMQVVRWILSQDVCVRCIQLH
jgi:hypothetical protein